MSHPVSCEQLRAWHALASQALEKIQRKTEAQTLMPLVDLEAQLHEAWVDAAHAEARTPPPPEPRRILPSQQEFDAAYRAVAEALPRLGTPQDVLPAVLLAAMRQARYAGLGPESVLAALAALAAEVWGSAFKPHAVAEAMAQSMANRAEADAAHTGVALHPHEQELVAHIRRNRIPAPADLPAETTCHPVGRVNAQPVGLPGGRLPRAGVVEIFRTDAAVLLVALPTALTPGQALDLGLHLTSAAARIQGRLPPRPPTGTPPR